VVNTRRRRVIPEAIEVEIDLRAPLLQNRHDVVERAQSVRVCRAPGVGLIKRNDSVVTTSLTLARLCNGYYEADSWLRGGGHLHDEPDLLGWLHGRATQHLSSEVSSKRHELAGHESVLLAVS
jgi:hypothetical protein